jgi:hypothetical protein
MKRALVVLSTVLLLLALGSAREAHRLEAQEAPPPAPAGPPPSDPLEEFVPTEKLEADSVVSFPVDI